MSDTHLFEYDAPTYVDFAKGFDESEGDIDKFFDTVASSEASQGNLNSTVIINGNLTVPKIESEFCTPDKHSTPEPPKNSTSGIADYFNLERENLTPNVKDTCKTPNPQDGRRSRVLFEALEGLCPGSLKTHKMLTRKDPRTPLLELRSRTVPRNVNFMLNYDENQSKLAREIIFEDETDNLIHQMTNLSLARDIVQNTNQHDNSDTKSFLNETITIENNVNKKNCKDQHQDNEQVQFCDNETVGLKRKSGIYDPSTSLMHGNKFISLAAPVASPQYDYRLKENKLNPKTILHRTLPKTPNLQTKSRVRPSNILSHSQEEEKILKGLRENQPKARPIPKGLFDPPKLGVRRIAFPKYNFPANTESSKSISLAQQVPKILRVINAAKNDCVKVVDTDETGMTVINKEVGHRGVGVSLDTHQKNKNRRITKPQPFSFYEGDLERLRKKEEKIKKVIEEEKKLAEFHANPLPRFVLKAKKQLANSQGSLNSTTCSHSTTCTVTSEHFVFRANPPAVLHQKPFIPRKSMKPCGQVSEFTLHTEERSQQRELYESTKKQRELEMQLYLQEREREDKEREEAAYRAARKSTVHKPLPLPKFK